LLYSHHALKKCGLFEEVYQMMKVVNDGGRSAAGYKGSAGDCVARAISIASGRPYQEVYDRLAAGQASQRVTRKTKKQRRSARNGVHVKRKWFKDYMAELGFVWQATMQIGAGCKVHLKADELPAGRLVVMVSRHLVAVIDGVIHDTFDPSREGTRCVYGYWVFGEAKPADDPLTWFIAVGNNHGWGRSDKSEAQAIRYMNQNGLQGVKATEYVVYKATAEMTVEGVHGQISYPMPGPEPVLIRKVKRTIAGYKPPRRELDI
jgi:hypothetical protein